MRQITKFFFFLTFSFSLIAQQQIVYMVEEGDSKQIALSNGNGEFLQYVTEGTQWHLYPDIDATGRWVAYVEGEGTRNPKLKIVIKDLYSGLIEEWTGSQGLNLQPNFSGDGRFLTYSGPFGKDGKSKIAWLNLTELREKTTPEKIAPNRVRYSVTPQVIESEHACFFPRFTSDGAYVAFQRTKSETEKDIALYSLAEKKIVLILEEKGQSQSPAISFDNRWIAYTSKKDGEWNIYLYDRQEKQTQQITDTEFNDFAPTFKVDGSIIFASDREGNFQLYEITADSIAKKEFGAKLLVGGKGDRYAPAVTGDMRPKQSLSPSIPDPARSSFGAISYQGRIYVVGGHQGPEHTYPKESFVDRLDYFDLKTKRWHQGASRKVPTQGFDLAAYGDYLYAFGGFAYAELPYKPKWQSLDIIERYDIKADRWEIIGKMPRRRSSNVVAQVGTKVYLIGGWDATPSGPGDYEGHFHSEIDVFDLKTETITTLQSKLPKRIQSRVRPVNRFMGANSLSPLRRAFTSVVVKDEIYLVGGLGVGSTHFELIDLVTIYNPKTNQWREAAPLPFATFAPAVGVIEDRLYVFGGMFRTGKMSFEYVNHIFSMDPKENTWRHTGRYLSETKGFPLVVPTSSTELGILGGHSYEGHDAPVATFERFEVR